MNISRPFVARPVATTLLSCGLLLAGIITYFLLPVASLPEVDSPAIVVQAQLPGSSLPAVRIDLNPLTLFKHGIGLEDVRAAIAAANTNAPKGAIDGPRRRYQIYVNDTATTPEQYRSLIIACRNQAPVRLRDVAAVSDRRRTLHQRF